MIFGVGVGGGGGVGYTHGRMQWKHTASCVSPPESKGFLFVGCSVTVALALPILMRFGSLQIIVFVVTLFGGMA